MKISETEKIVAATLAGKQFYRPEMGPLLVAILNQKCQSDEHRRRVCDKAVLMRFGSQGEDRCPGPAELAEICEQVPAVVNITRDHFWLRVRRFGVDIRRKEWHIRS